MWKPGDNAPGKKKAGKASKKSRKRQRQEADPHVDRSSNALVASSSSPSQSNDNTSEDVKPTSTTPKPLSTSLSSLRFMSRVTDRVAREKEEKKAEHEERWVVPRNVLLGGVGADGASKLKCELATESDALAQVAPPQVRRSFGGFREMIKQQTDAAEEIKKRKAGGGGAAAGSNGRYHSAGSSKQDGGDNKRQRISSGGKKQLAKGSKKPAGIKKAKKKVGKLKRFKGK